MILTRMGVVWAVQGDIADAVSLFERALELHPEYHAARVNLDKYGAMMVD